MCGFLYIDILISDAHVKRLLLANAVATSPKQVSIHLSLSALSTLNVKQPGVAPTIESLTSVAQALLPSGIELPEEFPDAVGEMCVLIWLPNHYH